MNPSGKMSKSIGNSRLTKMKSKKGRSSARWRSRPQKCCEYSGVVAFSSPSSPAVPSGGSAGLTALDAPPTTLSTSSQTHFCSLVVFCSPYCYRILSSEWQNRRQPLWLRTSYSPLVRLYFDHTQIVLSVVGHLFVRPGGPIVATSHGRYVQRTLGTIETELTRSNPY